MQKTRGFSFLGSILIILLLGVAVYFTVPHFLGNSKQQKLDKINQDLTAINDALNQYKLDNGVYPTTEQGLDALVTQPTANPVPQFWNPKGYISPLPVDPWGQPYQYTDDPNDDVIRVYSYGSEGKNGGDEVDLTNINQQ